MVNTITPAKVRHPASRWHYQSLTNDLDNFHLDSSSFSLHEFGIPFHQFLLTSITQVLGAYFPFLHHHALCLATRIYPFLIALYSIFFIAISCLHSNLQPSALSFTSHLNYRRQNTPAKQSFVNFLYKERTKNSWETEKQPWPQDSVLPGENWETKKPAQSVRLSPPFSEHRAKCNF